MRLYIKIIPFWLIIYISGLIFRQLSIFPQYFMICIQFYLVTFGLLNILHAWKSYRENGKGKLWVHTINEIILGISYFALALYLPQIFPRELGLKFRFFIFFHLWNSLSVHILCWVVYLSIAKRNNEHFSRNLAYDEWLLLTTQVNAHKSDLQNDLRRKIMHYGITLGLLAIYFIGILFQVPLQDVGIPTQLFISYWWLTLGLHLLWVMNLADLIRLHRFKWLGRFATRWLERSIRQSEYHTFTSASIMIISWFPFLLAPSPIFLIVAVAGSFSDALASSIGKRWGKRSGKNGKTIAGYLAGFLSTFLITSIFFLLFSSQTYSGLELMLFATGAAFGFFIVDLASLPISDNFLNPIVIGTILWVLSLVI
ncbi:MAG: hypothetical protein ACTSYI_03130 [Promethearchaeota archaeon]